MFSNDVTVQLVAEQLHSNGAYVHVDTEYFSDASSIRDWLSGAVEWADRFRIFKVGASEFFYEGVVVNHKVPEWKKLRIDDHMVVDLYA